MINDSGMEIGQDVINDFVNESFLVLLDLKELINGFKDAEDNEVFSAFAEQIDCIMSSAYALSLTDIGDITKVGKELAEKAAKLEDVRRLLVVQSLLSQLVKHLDVGLKSFRKGARPDQDSTKLLLSKLTRANRNLSEA